MPPPTQICHLPDTPPSAAKHPGTVVSGPAGGATKRRANRMWTDPSARETEVLRLLTEGLTDRQHGDALLISPRTAGYHVTHLLTMDSRTAADAYAIRHGLALIALASRSVRGRREPHEEPDAHSQVDRLGSRVDIEFAEDVVDVGADRGPADEQRLGDLGIGPSFGEETQYIQFAL